jgi:hypothetical protein
MRPALYLSWCRNVVIGFWTFSEISGSGVDIPIPQVKIGLNFKTYKAEFVK